MEIPEHRKWMEKRVGLDKRRVTDEYMAGVKEFVKLACAQKSYKKEGKLRCPCQKCKCKKHHIVGDVMAHLCMKGFMDGYYYWTSHGERRPPIPPMVSTNSYYGSSGARDDFDGYEQMVMDAAGPSLGTYIEQQGFCYGEQMREDPNPEAKNFFDMLSAAQAPLYAGCESYSELSAAIEALGIKSDFNISETCFNRWVDFMGKALPNDNRMPKNFYCAKKSVEKLGLGCIKIHCCPNRCMIYYHPDDKNLRNCKICGEDRYKSVVRNGKVREVPLKKMWYFPLIPRLQRLYSSMQTASQMRWHRENVRESGYLSHPSDGEAWKHFDENHPEFAMDPRNVRLGLCADGFAPFDKTGRTYSCWPVILTPYNLPPWMCMRREFLFLTIIIPGPYNPKNKIDVCLQPLIDDLKLLWNSGVITYDVSLQQNFVMKACLLWTINDFPAYGMLSDWTTMGKLACPICMESSKAFTLKHSRKTSFFDCHRQFLPLDHCYRRNKNAFRKRHDETSLPPQRLTGEEMWERVKDLPSITGTPYDTLPGYGAFHHWTKQTIFWELPYWKTNLLPHNLDVMHIERNVFLNILYTVMDTKLLTKDNFNARLDLAEICRRKDLELQDGGGGKLKKPKAKYALTKQQRLSVCEWVKKLKLPDGYASTLSRCVDMREAKLLGMKSHDCHVFMQRLLPIAFKALPKPIWNTLTEFSQFFTELTSPLLKEDNIHAMEQNIPIILCKLEQIFPPSFFDSMEHLPIHLPYEARVGGPVQYRWMYPFERFIRTLKDKVTNQAAVEGSICEAYLVEETATFASYYYPPDIPCRRTRVPRNDDGGEGCSVRSPFSIFNYPGRPSGKCTSCLLEEREMKAAHLYVLLNCPEVEPFLTIYADMLQELGISDSEVDKEISTSFPNWFREYAKYKWLDKDEDAIKKSFNSRGSLALKNALFKVRSGKDEGGWIGENNLQELRVKWQAEDWQKLSLTNKQNRQAQDGHNVHSGGSISAREHAKKMKVDLNREPTLYELYERLHRPKGKPNEWLNEKQAKIAEIFQTQMTERQPQSGEGSSNNSTQQSDNDIYLEVVGGINKKGRIFGLGSQAATIKALMKDSISTDGTSAEEVAILKDKVQALTTELQQKNLEQEGIKQKVDRYERMFERLMLNKNLKALLIEPEEEAGNCNEEMGEDGLDGDSLLD